MALEPGGYADKLGNRYEGRWTVRQLLRVLNETLLAVELETVGDEQDGLDLCVELPTSVHRAEQCKSRNVNSNKWTIADLSNRRVLSAMKAFLDQNAQNQFAFVTTLPSVVLHDLCESARNSPGDPEQYYAHQVMKCGSVRQREFVSFCERIGLNKDDPKDRAIAFSYLSRLFFELWPDNTTTRDDLLEQAATLVSGNPTITVAVLADFAQSNLRQRLDGTAIWQHLKSLGLHPRRLEHDLRVLPTIKDLQQRFSSSIEPYLVENQLIPRTETDSIIAALENHAVVVLHGLPGQGKSGVLYELTTKLAQTGIVYLPIRLDRYEPRHNSKQFGSDLGLPESPVHALSSIARDRPAVLILDQLDAIRWTSRHSMNAIEVCKSLLGEVRSLRELGGQISVVLACRTYDLQNDPQIESWFRTEKTDKPGSVAEVKLALLSPEVVKDVVRRVGGDGKISDRQLQILQTPQQLTMWVHIVKTQGAFEFQNRVQLMRHFMASRMRELKQAGIAACDVIATLTSIVGYMETNGSIAAPPSCVVDQPTLDGLCSCGLIKKDQGQIIFSHQSYLDFQVASRVVREIYATAQKITTWLGGKAEQSLFRREQLRQALCLMNDESPSHFLSSVKTILASDQIRFHLKHLCLEVVGQLDQPSAKLCDFLADLCNSDEWKEHVFGAVYYRHLPYVQQLLENGTIEKWLASDLMRNYALWLMRGVSETIADQVARLLRPYLNESEEWNDRISATLPWHPHEDSDEVFALRLDLARTGNYRDYVDWKKLSPDRCLELLESVISTWEPEQLPRRGASRRRSGFESWPHEGVATLIVAAERYPEKTWEMFVPHIERLAPVADEPYGVLEQWIEADSHDGHQGIDSVPHSLVQIVITAGKCLARLNATMFWDSTNRLREHPSPVIQFILIETYAELQKSHSDAVIEWLLADLARLSIGTGTNEPEWSAASKLICNLSPYCDAKVFGRLERTLIHYHSPEELRHAEYWVTTWKYGIFGDYWGRAQHFLLPSLYPARRSDEVTGLIGVLERKFSTYDSDRFLRRSRIRSGFVGSTLGSSAERMSDKAWLKLITNTKVAFEDRGNHRWYEGHFSESSVRYFSLDLSRMAKRFPERFGTLALSFPADVAPDYRAAILDGLTKNDVKDVPENEQASWSPAPASLVEKVLAHFPADSSRTFAMSYCWLMYHRADQSWSASAHANLKNYACNHSDPKAKNLVISNQGGGFDAAEASVANLENNALNCVRAVAGLAIGEQIRNHPELFDSYRTTLAHLCNDPHPAVRLAGIEACLTVVNSDRKFAIKNFSSAASGDIRVAASRWGRYFFNTGMENSYNLLAPIVLAMLKSERPDVREEGACEVAARWMFHNYFEEQLGACIAGSNEERTGVARVAAQLVTEPLYFDKCMQLINQLKNDTDKNVRQALRGFMSSSDVLNTLAGIALVKEFVESESFLEDPSPLIYMLQGHEGSLLPFQDVLFAVCDQFVGPLSEATKNSGQGTMYDLSQLLPILVRLYEEADELEDVQVVNKCLDAFDAMFRQRLGVVSDISEIIG